MDSVIISMLIDQVKTTSTSTGTENVGFIGGQSEMDSVIISMLIDQVKTTSLVLKDRTGRLRHSGETRSILYPSCK